MNRIFSLALVALLGFAPSDAIARFDSDAEHACKRQGRAAHGATGFRGITVAKRGRNDFKVTGVMSRRGQADTSFTCRYRNNSVTEFSAKGGGSDASAALGAVAGIAAAAIIIGALSDDHKHDHHVTPSKPHHQGGWNDSFSPRNGFTCYERQRACYRPDGKFAPKMTRNQFGSGAARPKPNSAGVAERDMARFCQGEAAGKFHVSPREISTLPLERSRGSYFVYGEFPGRHGKPHVFTCNFNSAREFVRVTRG